MLQHNWNFSFET